MKWPWSDPDDPRPVFSRRGQAVGALQNVGAAVFAQMREGDEVVLRFTGGKFVPEIRIDKAEGWTFLVD